MPSRSLVCRGLALSVICVLVAFGLPSWRAAAPPFQRDRSSPMWGGSPQRNLVNPFEKGIASDWNSRPEKERNVQWKAELGNRVRSPAPVIAGGKIFLGTNNDRPRDKAVKGDKGVLMCFRQSDGKFLWHIVHDKGPRDRQSSDWPEEAVFSAPAVEGDRLWYVNNRCEVICASTDGKVLWKLDMIKKLGVLPHNRLACSPLLVGDTLFVVTSNGIDAGHYRVLAPNAPSFLALDKKTGKVIWSSKLPGKNILHGQWSSPVFADVKGRPQVIFPGGDGWLYSLDPTTGGLIWKFDCNPKGSKYRLGPEGTRNHFSATPIVADNRLYVAVGEDPEHRKSVGWLWCIDVTRKPTKKDKDLSPWSDPKVEVPDGFDPKDPRNKGSGLVWAYGGKNPNAGDEDRLYKFGRSLSTCAVHDGLCFAADYDGVLYCFDARTGKKHWEYDTEAEAWSSPYVVDGKVYFGNDAGNMHVFEASSKKKLINKVQMKGRLRVTPVAVDGVLYVITENPCVLWAIKAK